MGGNVVINRGRVMFIWESVFLDLRGWIEFVFIFYSFWIYDDSMCRCVIGVYEFL